MADPEWVLGRDATLSDRGWNLRLFRVVRFERKTSQEVHDRFSISRHLRADQGAA